MSELQRTKYVSQNIMTRMAEVLENKILVAVIMLSPFVDPFPSDEWPQALIEAKEHPILMSALGGLIWYLRSVSMEESVVKPVY